MLRIRDIMTRKVFALPASASLEEAAAALVAQDIGGAPVRDDEGKIVGVLSRSDLTDPERVTSLTESHRGPGRLPTAGDLMTPGFVAAHESDLLIDAVRLLANEGPHRLLILDEQGELAGIVTAADVLRALLAPAPAKHGGESEPAPPTLH